VALRKLVDDLLSDLIRRIAGEPGAMARDGIAELTAEERETRRRSACIYTLLHFVLNLVPDEGREREREREGGDTDRSRQAFLHDRPSRFIPCNEKSLAARYIR